MGDSVNKSSRILFALAITLAALPVRSPSAAENLRFFKIASGSTGGTYYPIAGLLAQVISNPPGSKDCKDGGNCGVPGLTATALSSAGSVANVDTLLTDKVPSAIAQADVAYWAYSGTGPFRTRKPNDKLCVITSLYPEDIHLVSSKNAGIDSILGLTGKRVALGERDSGALLGAQLVVRAFGLAEGKDFTATYTNFSGARDLMQAGKIDAFITVSGYPNKAISEMAATTGIHLVPISGEGRQKLITSAPFYIASTVPAGIYAGQQQAIETVAVNALWLARSNIDADLIYRITKAFWTNKFARGILEGGHEKGHQITLASAFDGVPIPLCAGAQTFYKEAGRLK